MAILRVEKKEEAKTDNLTCPELPCENFRGDGHGGSGGNSQSKEEDGDGMAMTCEIRNALSNPPPAIAAPTVPYRTVPITAFTRESFLNNQEEF